ncbi:MAG: Abi family protein [Proteobacteria bacterium]|nr:Abi family protein [Pseudomonadota bacterium]
MTSSEAFEAALSPERFARYLAWAGGDREHARHLYTLNTQISEALYTPLQMLEVVLRNRIDTVMSASQGERWFDREGLLAIEHQRQQLAKAAEDIRKDGRPPTAGRIVAALSFSFWTAMVSPAYEGLWQVSLHRIARRDDGKGVRRQDLSGPLTPIRTLRNRIAHHEPILQWNLPAHYANMLRVTAWLSAAAAQWCRTYSRFEQVHPVQRIALVLPPESPIDGTPA